MSLLIIPLVGIFILSCDIFYYKSKFTVNNNTYFTKTDYSKNITLILIIVILVIIYYLLLT